MSLGWFDAIQMAYRVELDDREWLDGLTHVISDLVPGEGAMVYAYDASRPDEGVDIHDVCSVGVTDEYREATLELNARSLPEEIPYIYHQGVLCATVSEVQANHHAMASSSFMDLVAPINADTFGLSASDPTHCGVGISSPLECELSLRSDVRDAWRRLGVHLSAAWRLRRRLASGEVSTIDDADGRIATALLERDAARAESANGRPHKGLEIWRGLVDGLWTLIERCDDAGERHYVLIENDYGASAADGLTPRERQVLAHAVQGESNKWIAYQLGIAIGTVATLLTRAQSKLGVDSRRELIWLYQHLHS